MNLLPQHGVICQPADNQCTLGPRCDLLRHPDLLDRAVVHHRRTYPESAVRTQPRVTVQVERRDHAAGRVNHLSLNGITALQHVQALGGAAGRLALAAKM